MSRKTVRTPCVEFSAKGLTPERAGDVVRREGVIFRAGEYPRQRFKKTTEQLREFVRKFVPVPIDHGHPSAAGPFDGKLGRLVSVRLSEDDTTVYGTVETPTIIEPLFDGIRLKVSTNWDRITEDLKSLSLVTNPQIEDAELIAAFHAGAGSCSCGGKGKGTPPAFSEGGKPMAGEGEDRRARLKARLDDLDEATLEAMETAWNAPDDEEEEALEAASTAAVSAAADDPRFSEMEAQLAELRAEREVAFARQADDEAARAALDLVREGRLAVHQGKTAAAVLAQAARDDRDDASASVAFFDGGKEATGSRREALLALFAAAEPRPFAERFSSDPSRLEGAVLLSMDSKDAKPADWKEKRLANTNTGRAILARRNGNGAH